MGTSFFSEQLQKTFFSKELPKIPVYELNILLYEAELLAEDLEIYLDKERDSEDLDWIKRISFKIRVTKKFALSCRTVLKGNVQDKRTRKLIAQYEKQIKAYTLFVDAFSETFAKSLNSENVDLMRLFFMFGKCLAYASRGKQIKYFEDKFKNIKDEETLKLALEISHELYFDSHHIKASRQAVILKTLRQLKMPTCDELSA
tara:strand:- start:268 stop:873 length:606 start_codon:yes stop_codon:yes gene_type:complete